MKECIKHYSILQPFGENEYGTVYVKTYTVIMTKLTPYQLVSSEWYVIYIIQ